MSAQDNSGDESLITDAVRAQLSVASEPVPVTLSHELVRRVRETLDDRSGDDDSVPQAVLCALESNLGLAPIAGLPDGSLITGDEWEWLRPFRAGETLMAVERLTDARERMGGRIGHTLLLSYEWRFSDTDGAPVAYLRRSIAHYAAAGARPASATSASPSLGAADFQTAPPDAVVRNGAEIGVTAESPALAAGSRAERRDGAASPPEASAAQVGDPLPTRVLRPTLAQVVRYCGMAWSFQPIFFDPTVAWARGLPGTIIPGPLKLALLTRGLVEWAGEGSFLEQVRVAYRRPDQPGLPLRCGGSVLSRESGEAGDHLECDLWLEQEQGDRSTIGAATVRLRA